MVGGSVGLWGRVWLLYVFPLASSFLASCGPDWTSVLLDPHTCPRPTAQTRLCEQADMAQNVLKPKISIQTIPDKDLEGKRVFVIGDVHGCYDVMVQLLAKADTLESQSPKLVLKDDVVLVFVGDLVNKGPESDKVLGFVRDTPNAYSVMGNHEVYWIKGSGLFNLNPDDLKFLKSLPYILRIPKYNALIVHAGFMPNTPLENQSKHAITNMRNVVDSGDTLRPYTETNQGVHWASLWAGPEHVYFGHDARRGKDEQGRPRVQRFPLATGLDTRCVKGGDLTGLFLPVEKEQFHSVHNPTRYDFS